MSTLAADGRRPLHGVIVFSVSLAASIALAAAAAAAAGVPIGQLGLYFDGRVYIEIAKSFPLPYATEGPDYWSHAPGYPALIRLLRIATFSQVHWGWLALAASWLSAAGAAVVFQRICLRLELPPVAPTLAFVLLNPQWLLSGSAAQAESPAMLLALACLLCALDGRLGRAVVWLTLASLTRYPALLLGIPLALDVLYARRRDPLRSLAWLAVPVAVFALWSLYLSLHIADFPGLTHARRVPITDDLSWPFVPLLEIAIRRGPSFRTAAILATFALHLVSFGAGLRPRERRLLLLPLWVIVIAAFHGALGRPLYAIDYPRLALLAWPASLLACWRWEALRRIGRAWLPLMAALVLVGGVSAQHRLAQAVSFQQRGAWFRAAIEPLLHDEEPSWFSGWAPREGPAER